jgi:hypothetical protein
MMSWACPKHINTAADLLTFGARVKSVGGEARSLRDIGRAGGGQALWTGTPAGV